MKTFSEGLAMSALDRLYMEGYDKGFSDCQAAATKAAEEAINMAILLENESCANIVEEDKIARPAEYVRHLERVAAAIRARGEK